MAFLELPQKAIDKTYKELIELHKRVLLQYLLERDVSFKGRKKFWVIYDHYINIQNISDYFHAPCKLFVMALLQDRLDDIKGLTRITPITTPKKKRKKKGKKSCLKRM